MNAAAGLTIGILLLALCLLGRLTSLLFAKTRTQRLIIDEQSRQIERQSEALRQTTDGLDPGRLVARDFERRTSRGRRRDLTAFFAEWGRAHLQHTDIRETFISDDE